MIVKRYFWVFIILPLLVGGCGGTVNVHVKPNALSLTGKTVAVLEFKYEPKPDVASLLYGATWTQNAGEMVSDQISNALLKFGDIEIIERSQIRRIIEEQKFSLSDLVEKGEYQMIGKLAEADYLIFGTVNEHCAIGITGIVRGFAGFSVKCVSVETGKHVWSGAVTSSSFYASPTSISQRLAERVVSKLKSELGRGTKNEVKKTSGTNIIPLRKHEGESSTP